jgi:hypothetical protein
VNGIVSVVIGAAQVIAALSADELAVVAGEAVTARGADLAVVVDGNLPRSRGLLLRDMPFLLGNKIGVEGAGTFGQHG